MHTRRNHLILVSIIMAAVVGVALLGVPGSPIHKKTRLGLDLQGGLEVVLQAVPPKGQKITQQGLDNAVTIMRNRVDKLGVAEPEIRKQGNDQIVIELPGVKNAAQAASLIGKTAQLEFFDLQADVTGPSVGTSGFVRYPVAASSLFNMLAGQQAKAKTGHADRLLPVREEQEDHRRPLGDPRRPVQPERPRRCQRAARCLRCPPAPS